MDGTGGDQKLLADRWVADPPGFSSHIDSLPAHAHEVEEIKDLTGATPPRGQVQPKVSPLRSVTWLADPQP